MQYSSIELKSSKYTLTLIMDPSVPFERILADVTDKFRSSARFFRGAQMALEFRGRNLTQDEQHKIVNAITSGCGLDIICILEMDEDKEELQYTAITQVLRDRPQTSDSHWAQGSTRRPCGVMPVPPQVGHAPLLNEGQFLRSRP